MIIKPRNYQAKFKLILSLYCPVHLKLWVPKVCETVFIQLGVFSPKRNYLNFQHDPGILYFWALDKPFGFHSSTVTSGHWTKVSESRSNKKKKCKPISWPSSLDLSVSFWLVFGLCPGILIQKLAYLIILLADHGLPFLTLEYKCSWKGTWNYQVG